MLGTTYDLRGILNITRCAVTPGTGRCNRRL